MASLEEKVRALQDRLLAHREDRGNAGERPHLRHGTRGRGYLASFGQTDAESKKYDSEGYFVQRKNSISERAKFNQRVQAESETVDQFLTALNALVEHCEYEGLKEQMIPDCLVVGLCDSILSERLQFDSDLVLKKASPWHATAKLDKRSQRLCGDQRLLQPPQIWQLFAKRLGGKTNIDSTSEREKLDRLARRSKQSLASGVEGKLILAQRCSS